MLIFGHAGITLGTAIFLNGTLVKNYPLHTREEKEHPRSSSDSRISWLTSLGNRIDIRLLLVGSLLPDIIDKPIGHFFFRETFSNGRIFCHTLLFLITVTLGGLYLYWSRSKTWLLVLSFGTFTHLVLDLMWLTPRTLLWPLHGFSFERIDLSQWMEEMFHALLTNPVVSIPDLLGAVIIIWFVWLLVRRGKLYAFIRNGQV